MSEINIYGAIGENFWEPEKSLTGETIKNQLPEGDITVRIDSPGGDVFAGLAIYNLLKQHDGKVTVYVDSWAASAASIIAMAGDDIYMPKTSMMMIHDPWTMAVGDAAEMNKTADMLLQIKSALIPAYAEKTGLSEQVIGDMMEKETWMTGTEAAAQGFATLIDGDAKPTTSNSAMPWIKNAPTITSLTGSITGGINELSIDGIQLAASSYHTGIPPVIEPEPNPKQFKVALEKRRLRLI